ncbi:hypothetical protein JBO49_02720 [Serratia fonticola]|uniref:hypothetical protein n=1 Tax=Serratia fonticola TaxID=47917 RepID=UPI00192B328D|nr:hypothetical protein [Serratia fonticola]MBL5859525.1 hypothetical protein [Serratia fonticola]
MSLSCKSCKKEVDELDLEQANIMQDCDDAWCVDLILKCPHCGQSYNTFVPTGDLVTIEPQA